MKTSLITTKNIHTIMAKQHLPWHETLHAIFLHAVNKVFLDTMKSLDGIDDVDLLSRILGVEQLIPEQKYH